MDRSYGVWILEKEDIFNRGSLAKSLPERRVKNQKLLLENGN